MNVRTLISAASIALLPLAASAASLIVPAAGTGLGANNSRWQTELTIHNLSNSPTNIVVVFHDATGSAGSVALPVAPRATVSLEDIVKTKLNLDMATGALELQLTDGARVAVTSRTANVGPAGDLGQDIPAIADSDALAAGDMAVLNAPSSVSAARFNFGVYALTDASIQWQLLRDDGSVAATVEKDYKGGTQLQYNSGVKTFLGAEPAGNDVVIARVLAGKAMVYGSAISQLSGDPTFVPAIRGHEDSAIQFVGVDVNEDGVVEVKADASGKLAGSLDIFTSMYPNYFKVVTTTGGSAAPTFKVLSVTGGDITILADGTIMWGATGDLKGKTGELRLLATTGDASTTIVIPVNFR